MRKALFSFVFIMLLIFLSSCSLQEESMYGDITVVFDSQKRAIDSNISMETDSYKITFSGPNGENEISTANKSATSVSRKGLAAGEWIITVEAVNADSTVIGLGSTKVEIKKGEMTTANITVTELEGDGTLSVTIYGDNPNSSTYTLEVYKNDSGTDTLVISQEFSSADSVLKAEVTLSNGYYIIKVVSSTASEQCPAPETVRIVKGDTVSTSYTITEGEDRVSITVNNLILRSPELSLSFSSSFPHAGDSVTVTAKGMEEGSCKYEWYLYDTKVTGNTSSITVDSLTSVGDYVVTCIVRDTESSLTWSVSKVLTVYDDSYKPQTITVNGEVEFFLAGDVAISQKLNFQVKNKNTSEVVCKWKHEIVTFSNSTEIYCELSGEEGYTYYFEEKYLEEKNRTLVYIVIDKDIEDYGYVCVKDNNLADFLDPYRRIYYGINIDENRRYIPVLPYGDSRSIKLECGTYTQRGNSGVVLPSCYLKLSPSSFVVEKDKSVELTYADNYCTYVISSSSFADTRYYNVALMTEDNDCVCLSTFRAEDGKLIIPVSEREYDYVVIYNLGKDEYCKIDTPLTVGTTKEYTAVFSPLGYEEGSSVTAAAGRVKVKWVVDGLRPKNISEMYYKFIDSSGAVLAWDSVDALNGERSFNFAVETKIYIVDPLNLGDVTVTASKESDTEGDYTLIELRFSESGDNKGTLIINYSLPSGISISTSNYVYFCIRASETGKIYDLTIRQTETQTFSAREGQYYTYSSSAIQDSSGTWYRPRIEGGSFSIKKGETTAVTVVFVKDDSL